MTYDEQDLLDLDMAERSQVVASVFQNPKTQFYAVNSTDEMAFALENHNLKIWSLYICIRLQCLKNRKRIKIEGILDSNMTVFLKSNQKVCLLVNNNENLLKIT